MRVEQVILGDTMVAGLGHDGRDYFLFGTIPTPKYQFDIHRQYLDGGFSTHRVHCQNSEHLANVWAATFHGDHYRVFDTTRTTPSCRFDDMTFYGYAYDPSNTSVYFVLYEINRDWEPVRLECLNAAPHHNFWGEPLPYIVKKIDGGIVLPQGHLHNSRGEKVVTPTRKNFHAAGDTLVHFGDLHVVVYSISTSLEFRVRDFDPVAMSLGKPVHSLTVSPSGKTIAIGFGGTLSLWTSQLGLIASFDLAGGEVHHIVWSPDGLTVAAMTYNRPNSFSAVFTVTVIDNDWE